MDPNDKNRPTVYRSATDFINRADFRPFAIPFKKKKKQTAKEIASLKIKSVGMQQNL